MGSYVGTNASSSSSASSYKYRWARMVTRHALKADFAVLSQKLGSVPNQVPAGTLTDLINNTRKESYAPGPPPKSEGQFKVGIVGAGCSGLFTAMIIDYLNERVGGLDIDYDILEAANETRLGGRLYTHYFSADKHDYYDVGAMRFPKNKIMDRTFQLFTYLGLDDKLITYYMDDKSYVDTKISKCPTYYNDQHHVGKPSGYDPYKVNERLPPDQQIPRHLLEQNPGDLVANAVKGLTDAFKEVLDSPSGATDGWDLLMKADYMSTRQYFRATKVEGLPDGPGYDYNTIEWLETFAYATGWYNQSLAETVLEILDFEADDFKCLEGGTQQVATAMAKMLKKQPEFNMEVTAIDASRSEEGIRRLRVNDRSGSGSEYRDYYAVFNSTTLGALQRMDLTKAGLDYGTKQAIRSLAYGASCKVGIKFKTGWWQNPPYNIKGGLGKTDLPLRVCVYPSYNLDDADKNCVLLCSYTWAQDAQRIGSLISPNSPENENELLETLFHNLALLHKAENVPYEDTLKMIQEQYLTHHSYNWYDDQNMSGAFAYFGPGQFSNTWPKIISPNGWLFLIGEAASAHHAWIVGAIESAVRGIWQMLEMLHLNSPDFEPYLTAMDLLRSPPKADQHLPFNPLPEEVPRMQADADKKAETTDFPTEGSPLSFTAAQVILSYLESIADEALAEAVTEGEKSIPTNIAIKTQ